MEMTATKRLADDALSDLIPKRTVRGKSGHLESVSFVQSTCISPARNRVNSAMSPLTEALSSAAMYDALRVTRTIVQGYPPDASMAFIRNRPMRPLPSG